MTFSVDEPKSDFFFRQEHLKHVYSVPPRTLEDIVASCGRCQRVRRVVENVVRRTAVYLETERPLRTHHEITLVLSLDSLCHLTFTHISQNKRLSILLAILNKCNSFHLFYEEKITRRRACVRISFRPVYFVSTMQQGCKVTCKILRVLLYLLRNIIFTEQCVYAQSQALCKSTE